MRGDYTKIGKENVNPTAEQVGKRQLSDKREVAALSESRLQSDTANSKSSAKTSGLTSVQAAETASKRQKTSHHHGSQQFEILADDFPDDDLEEFGSTSANSTGVSKKELDRMVKQLEDVADDDWDSFGLAVSTSRSKQEEEIEHMLKQARDLSDDDWDNFGLIVSTSQSKQEEEIEHMLKQAGDLSDDDWEEYCSRVSAGKSCKEEIEQVGEQAEALEDDDFEDEVIAEAEELDTTLQQDNVSEEDVQPEHVQNGRATKLDPAKYAKIGHNDVRPSSNSSAETKARNQNRFRRMVFDAVTIRKEQAAAGSVAFVASQRSIFNRMSIMAFMRLIFKATPSAVQEILGRKNFSRKDWMELPRCSDQLLRQHGVYGDWMITPTGDWLYIGSGTSVDGMARRWLTYNNCKAKHYSSEKNCHMKVAMDKKASMHIRSLCNFDPVLVRKGIVVAVEGIFTDLFQTLDRKYDPWEGKANLFSAATVKAHRDAAPIDRQGDLPYRGANRAHQFAQGASGSHLMTRVLRQKQRCGICEKERPLFCGSRLPGKKHGNLAWSYCPTKLDNVLDGKVVCRHCIHIWRDTDLAKDKTDCTDAALGRYLEYRRNPTPELNAEFKLKCKKCDRPFDWEMSLSKHEAICTGPVKKSTGPLTFKCDKCPEAYATEAELTAHAVRHDTDKNPFKCGHCGIGFPSKANRDQHARTHLPPAERTENCKYCQKPFTNPSSLRKHIKKQHEATVAKYKCSLCDKGYDRNGNLQTHMRTEHPGQ